MAVFYVAEDESGEVVAAETTLKAAKAADGATRIVKITMAVSTENVRKLLAYEGGYADSEEAIEL